jgi:hypothetical protein
VSSSAPLSPFSFPAVLVFELRAYTSPFSVMGFFEIVYETLFAWLASNHDPPDLCFLNSYDHRHEPLVPGIISFSFLFCDTGV